MLTALSVGRECGLVSPQQQVITIRAAAPQQSSSASLTFHANRTNSSSSSLVCCLLFLSLFHDIAIFIVVPYYVHLLGNIHPHV